MRQTLTWVDYCALREHWAHEPPPQAILAAYFKIPPRERPHVLTEAEIIADFAALGLTRGL